MQLTRDYDAFITEPIPVTSSGEFSITLSKTPDSDNGFLFLEPSSATKKETIFFHRRVGNIVYAYHINRSNNVEHLDNAQVLLSNSIDYMNYALKQTHDQTYIYQKDTQNIVITGGTFYIDGVNVTIADVDTSAAVANKILIAGSLNYIYIVANDYKIVTTPITSEAYLVATVDVSIGGVVTTITRKNTFVVGNKGETGASVVSADFIGNDLVFTKDDAGTVTVVGAKTISQEGNTIGNTAGNTTGNTVGNTTGNTIGNTVGNTTGNQTGNTTGNTVGNTTGNTLNNTDGNTIGNTTGNTFGNTTGNTTGNQIGNTVGNTTGNTLNNTAGNTAGNTTGNQVGNTVGNTTGNTTGNTLNNTDGNTTGNTIGNTVGNTTGNTVGNTTGNTIGNTVGTVQWKGLWSAGSYLLNDGVSYLGTSYVANINTSNTPPHADWTVMAAKGDTGIGDMLKSENLSGLTNYVTARSNLGLGSLATQSGTFSGTSSGTNTGDETTATIKTKLSITTLSGSNTGDQDLSGYQLLSAKDAVSGYAGLDGSGKINPAQLPALAITDTFVVASEVAMLALTADVGDVAVRTDLNKSFILRVAGATLLANWQELLTPIAAVSSVFGRSGTITAQSGDYTVDQITNAVSTLGSYANPTWITSLAGSKVSGNISGNAAGLSSTLSIASGGTNTTSFTAPVGTLCGIIYYNGTLLATDVTTSHLGYDTATDTMYTGAINISNATTATAKFTNTATSGTLSGAGMQGLSDDGAAMSSGDRLGFYALGGATNASHTTANASIIEAFATEAWSGTVNGSSLVFSTTANGGQVRSAALTLGQDKSATFTGVISATNLSGTNTGDNATNTQYSGLVSNATHTGDATGATALTVVALNGTNLATLATGILKNTTGTGVPSIAVAGDFPTLNQNTTGSAATLTTPRAIYGNNFDGSAALTQIIASTYGGTGNGFTKFTGPTTAEKTFTLPDASATLLYSGGALGTPSSGTLTNCTFPTLNQSTTGSAATLTTARSIFGNSFNGSADISNTATVGTASTTAGKVVFNNATNAFTQTFTGSNPGASIEYILPTTAPTAGQVLSSTAPSAGVATLSWATAAGLSWGSSINGATGTGLALAMGNSYAASGIGQSITIGNTQTNVLTALNIDTGTADALNMVGLNIKALNVGNGSAVGGITLNSFSGATQCIFQSVGLRYGDNFNTSSSINTWGAKFTVSSNVSTGKNTGVWIENNTTSLNTLGNTNANTGILLRQIGVGGTAMHLYTADNVNSSTNGLVNYTLSNTQSGATVMQKIDLGTSAQGHTGLLVNAYNASTSARGIKIDLSSTGTGHGLEIAASGGAYVRGVSLSAYVVGAGVVGGYGYYAQGAISVNGGVGSCFVVNGVTASGISSGTGYGFRVLNVSIGTASANSYGIYIDNLYSSVGGTGARYFSFNNTQSGDLTASTQDSSETLHSRTHTHTTGSKTDIYNLSYWKRTNVQNGAGGTLLSQGSVLKLENVATQIAGTLTDTVDVYNATQSATITTGKLFTGVVGSTERFKVHPMVADSGTNNAYLFDTTTSLTGTTTLAVFANAGTAKVTVNNAGNYVSTGSLKTAAPTTGTAAAWKLGSYVGTGTSTLRTDAYVELDIGGTLYKVALCTNA